MVAAQVQPIVHRMPARELSLCVRQPKIHATALSCVRFSLPRR
jgi:hypothetical protein